MHARKGYLALLLFVTFMVSWTSKARAEDDKKEAAKAVTTIAVASSKGGLNVNKPKE